MPHDTLPYMKNIVIAAICGIILGSAVTHLYLKNNKVGIPLVYTNEQYGFKFSLSESWKGYSVLENIWKGENPKNRTEFESGPELVIRHPSWTKEIPYQDIPIMIFTHSQWDDAQKMKIVLWAGGIPEELGRNPKYIFILPPRYNFADGPKGIPEVNAIMQSKPLEAF